MGRGRTAEGPAASELGFWIHVSPRARREGVGGRHGDALRVAVKEPPVNGKEISLPS